MGPTGSICGGGWCQLLARGKALMESYLSKLYYSDVPRPADPEQTCR